MYVVVQSTEALLVYSNTVSLQCTLWYSLQRLSFEVATAILNNLVTSYLCCEVQQHTHISYTYIHTYILTYMYIHVVATIFAWCRIMFH